MDDSLAVILHRVNALEKQHNKVDEYNKSLDLRIDDIEKNQSKIEFTLENMMQTQKEIKEELKAIKANQEKDQGWRVVLLDFIKASAQIAALIGAGKFIF